MPITVFIVDDHAIFREGLIHLLNTHQDMHVVGVASNGRDAVRQVSQLRPNVAITDIAMPEMNGIEATRQFLERSPETRVVILSMHSTPDHVFHAMEAGARGYILKEDAGGDIVKAVRAVHAGERYLCRKIVEILADQFTQSSSDNPFGSLSKREREVLQLVVEGRTSIEIATKLSLSPKSVDTYRSRLMQKLQIHDIAGLVKFSIQHGLTTLD